MTQQYLIGELSVRLEQLQAVATSGAASELARLRHDVEAGPVHALAAATAHAIALANGLCWESLGHGDAAAFARQARVSADLRQFGICAHLLTDCHAE